MRSEMLGVIVLAGLVASATAAEEACQRDRITVEGQAEVRVKPELVRIVMVAEQREPTLAPGEAAVKTATDALLALARESGVSGADIDSSDYVVQPQYEWTSGRKLGKRLGFHVRRTVKLTLRDVSRFGVLLGRVAEVGAVSVTSVDPDVESTRAHRDEARLRAVRAAREKAQAIVAELGQALGRATTIELDGASSACCGSAVPSPASFNNNYAALNSSSGPAESSHALGEITLTARVKVAFELK